MALHEIVRSRREVVRRTLAVKSTASVTPRMLRVVFESSELEGFDSPSPDDHVKIFLPAIVGAEPVKRDFTPRAWDTAAGTLTLEFALHDKGPAAEWARGCAVGDTLQIGGPKGSTVVTDDFDWYLLVGDACALPSIARRLEGLRAGVPAFMAALVAGPEEKQSFATKAELHARWVYHDVALNAGAADLLPVLTELSLPAGNGYVWVAGEDRMSREVYRYLVDERGHNPEWIKAAAYWTRGEAES